MQIHEIRPRSKRKKSRKIGRGGKRGTYSGRGIKGQKARSGGSVDPLFEGGRSSLIERMKKKKGFHSPYPKSLVISLEDLERKFPDGEVVNEENLICFGLLKKTKTRRADIKILGKGKLTKRLKIDKKLKLSRSASQAIGGLKNNKAE